MIPDTRHTPPVGLVIFDCDGVLVDSEPMSNREFTRALNEIGLEVTLDQVCRDFIGLSMKRCIDIVEQRLGRPVPPNFVEQLQRATFDAFRRELRPTCGVRETLERLDLPFCVASSGEIEKMRLTLGLTGLLQLFEGRMFSATEVERGKPDPDLFLHAARRMGFHAEECMVVEDSLPGVRAALAAGMCTVGFAPAGDTRGLAEAGAIVFHEMSELPRLIAETR